MAMHGQLFLAVLFIDHATMPFSLGFYFKNLFMNFLPLQLLVLY